MVAYIQDDHRLTPMAFSTAGFACATTKGFEFIRLKLHKTCGSSEACGSGEACGACETGVSCGASKTCAHHNIDSALLQSIGVGATVSFAACAAIK